MIACVPRAKFIAQVPPVAAVVQMVWPSAVNTVRPFKGSAGVPRSLTLAEMVTAFEGLGLALDEIVVAVLFGPAATLKPKVLTYSKGGLIKIAGIHKRRMVMECAPADKVTAGAPICAGMPYSPITLLLA